MRCGPPPLPRRTSSRGSRRRSPRPGWWTRSIRSIRHTRDSSHQVRRVGEPRFSESEVGARPETRIRRMARFGKLGDGSRRVARWREPFVGGACDAPQKASRRAVVTPRRAELARSIEPAQCLPHCACVGLHASAQQGRDAVVIRRRHGPRRRAGRGGNGCGGGRAHAGPCERERCDQCVERVRRGATHAG
jgi:hypothetical protein